MNYLFAVVLGVVQGITEFFAHLFHRSSYFNLQFVVFAGHGILEKVLRLPFSWGQF